MSAKQSGQVWELDLSHKEAWVLMALADHADHEGNNVFPGQGLIAWKTGYSERNVRRILESLENKGIIIPVSGGRGRGLNQEYRLALENARRKPPYSRKKRTKCPVKGAAKSGQNVRLKEPQKADKMSSFEHEEGNKKRTKRDGKSGQNETGKADNLNTSHDKERARINRHEPSKDPSNKKHVEFGADAPHVLSAAIQEVFEFWKAELNHPTSKLTLERKSAVERRLKDGYTIDQIKGAILGCRASPFHQGQNEHGRVHDDLELICRKGSKLESFIRIYQESHNGTNQRTPSQPGPRETHNARAARQTVELLFANAAFGPPDDHYELDSADPAPSGPAVDHGDG